MIDADIRTLERSARAGTPGADRKLAVARFRAGGDCVSGLCECEGCPACRLATLKREALDQVAKATTDRTIRAGLRKFIEGEDQWSYEDVDPYVERANPVVEARRRLARALDDRCIGYLFEVARNGGGILLEVRFGMPPADMEAQMVCIEPRIYSWGRRKRD